MKKSLKDSERQVTMVHGNRIQSIAVFGFYNHPQQYQEAAAYAEELRNRGIKKIDFFIGFSSKKSMQTFQASNHQIIFAPSDFNLLGKYKSEILLSAVQNEYDLLIDLTEGKSFASDIVIAKTKAKWKAGRTSAERSYLFDFMIEWPLDKGLKSFVQQMDLYLMKFNVS